MKCFCKKALPNVVTGRCYACDGYYRPDELPYEVVHPDDHGHYNTIDPTKVDTNGLDPTEMAA